MRSPAFLAAVIAAALVAGVLPARAEEPADPRGDMEALEAVLDDAVARVSRPSTAPFLGGVEASRGYRLRGYGAVIVLPPRALPRRGNVFVSGLASQGTLMHWSEEAPTALAPGESIDQALAELRAQQRQIESEIQSQQDGRKRTREARQRELKALEAQVEALQREAERTRQEAERALEEAVREVQVRLAPVPPAVAAPAVAAPEVAAPAVAAAAPESPAAPRAPVMPAPPSPPAPPWRFWFNTAEDDDARTPEKVVSDVKNVVTQVLESQGARLGVVRPDEFVTVAVDFVPQWGFFDEGVRPQKTLIIRVRKKELEDRAAGKIPTEELRKRIEYVEY